MKLPAWAAALVVAAALSPAVSGANPVVKTWRGGWQAVTVRVTEPGMTSSGDLRPVLPGADGWMYFGYGDALYRIDSLAGVLTRIRALPKYCIPVVDEAMRFSCGGEGRIVRVSGARADVFPVIAPQHCNFIAPGATSELSAQSLAVRGSAVWFAMPRADGIGMVDGRASRSWCVNDFVSPHQVVPTARGVWFTDDAGDVALLSGGRVVVRWRGLMRTLGRFPVLAPDARGGVFVVAGSTLLRLSADGGRRDIKLPHPAIGAVTTDREGRCWIELMTRRDDEPGEPVLLRIGLLRIDARGTRFYDLPLTGGEGGIVADRRGRLWLSDIHEFIVLTPPKNA